MWQRLTSFRDSENGAVTVDWVVLTSAIVGLAIAVVLLFANGTTTAGDTLRDGLLSIDVN